MKRTLEELLIKGDVIKLRLLSILTQEDERRLLIQEYDDIHLELKKELYDMIDKVNRHHELIAMWNIRLETLSKMENYLNDELVNYALSVVNELPFDLKLDIINKM